MNQELPTINSSRPAVLEGRTHKVRMGCGNVFLTLNWDEHGRLIETFGRLGKSGGCQGALLQAVLRLLSIALQSGIKPARLARTLAGIRCPEELPGERGQNPASCLDALARIFNTERTEKEG